jgi:hypothetical protein
MNTIKTDENLTVILPVMKDKQVITLHNVANNETYIFKSEIKEVEIEIDIKKSQDFDFWDTVNPKEVEAIKEAIKKAKEAKPDNYCNSNIPYNCQKSFMENKFELGAGSLTAKTKRWKPENSEKYGYVSDEGKWCVTFWDNSKYDNHRHAIGNCYPFTEEGKEQAIWEQVTRRKYETALWDAADWVEGDWYGAFFDKKTNSIKATNNSHFFYDGLPRFATEQSAIDAHTRILGDDAERYFKGRR